MGKIFVQQRRRLDPRQLPVLVLIVTLLFVLAIGFLVVTARARQHGAVLHWDLSIKNVIEPATPVGEYAALAVVFFLWILLLLPHIMTLMPARNTAQALYSSFAVAAASIVLSLGVSKFSASQTAPNTLNAALSAQSIWNVLLELFVAAGGNLLTQIFTVLLLVVIIVQHIRARNSRTLETPAGLGQIAAGAE